MVNRLGRFYVDEAVYKLTMEGVAESQAKMDKFEKSWRKSLASKGTAGIVQDVKKLDTEISKLSAHSKAVTDVSKNMTTGIAKTGNEAKKAGDKFGYLNAKIDNLSKLYDIQWAIKGMFMGVGWQLITTMIEGLKTVVKDLFMANVELESSMIAIETVAQRTGREFGEVKGVISSSFDAFTDKAKLTSGTMKLLSTSLSTEEIKLFINAVKQGSAAMGMDFNEQLELMARGFKQLTPNLLDNIGVTVYLDDVRKKASQSLGIEVGLLTEAQIHHQLLIEILKQTAKYEGLWEAQMDTTKGAIMAFHTQYKLFMQTVADSRPIKFAATETSRVLEQLRLAFTLTADYEKYGIKINKEYMDSVGKSDTRGWARLTERLMGPIRETGPGGILGLSGETKTALQDKVNAVDIIVDRLAEMRDVYGDNIIMGKDYNTFLKEGAEILNIQAIDLERLIGKEMELNAVKEESILLVETISGQMNNYSRELKENNETLWQSTEAYKGENKTMQLMLDWQSDLNAEIAESNRIIDENTSIIFDSNRELYLKNKLLKESKSRLSELSSQEKEANSILKETEDSLKNVNKQLEAKLRVLYPEQLATEKKLLQIQRDLEGARKTEGRAEDDLYKRAEPTLFRKRQKDYAEAQEEVMRYTEGEKKLKAALMAEIAALSRERDSYNNKIEREKATIQEIIGLISMESAVRDGLQTKVNSLKSSISDLNEEMTIERNNIALMLGEDGVLPMLETQIDDLKTAIDDMYKTWNDNNFDTKTISTLRHYPTVGVDILAEMRKALGIDISEGLKIPDILPSSETISPLRDTSNDNRTSNTSNTFQPGSIIIGGSRDMSIGGLFKQVDRESKFLMAQTSNE